MYDWLAPLFWGIGSVLGDWMMFAGLLLLIATTLFILYRACEAALEKGENHEDQSGSQ